MSLREKDQSLERFEEQLRLTLQGSVEGVDARLRSRLNQARQAAVAEAGRRPAWRLSWVPALGAVTAVLLVALLLDYQVPRPTPAPTAELRPSAEDLDLLADGEGLDLVQSDGSFYEWALAEADSESGNGV